MKNKYFPFLLILIFLVSCQKSNNEIYSDEFKWNIIIPEDYKSVPLTENKQKKGKKMIEEVYNQKVKIVAIPIFNFMKGNTSKFQAQYTELDSSENFEKEFNQANAILKKTFKYQRPQSKYSTDTSNKIISGLKFKTFEMKIQSNDSITTTFKNYSRMFDNKKLDIIIVYQNEENGDKLIKALEKSKFD